MPLELPAYALRGFPGLALPSALESVKARSAGHFWHPPKTLLRGLPQVIALPRLIRSASNPPETDVF